MPVADATGRIPKWRTVHSYFGKWSEPRQDGIIVLERALRRNGFEFQLLAGGIHI
jgi:hypothetical protein